jgi:DNA-binding NarL/FixJ family response regulator
VRDKLTRAGPLTIVIADDHAIFRQALRLTLTHRARGMSVVAEAENGEQAIENVAEHHPNVLVLDLGLPKKSTHDLLYEVRMADPSTRVIILTGFADAENVRSAARGGAKAIVLKSGPLERLLEAVEAVARGDLWADPLLTMASYQEFLRLAGGAGDAQVTNPLRALSRREIDVVRLIADGLSNRDVAAKLWISEKTVTSHLNHIFEKLGVVSRLQAALLYNNVTKGHAG